jgi:hypothetical protein
MWGCYSAGAEEFLSVSDHPADIERDRSTRQAFIEAAKDAGITPAFLARELRDLITMAREDSPGEFRRTIEMTARLIGAGPRPARLDVTVLNEQRIAQAAFGDGSVPGLASPSDLLLLSPEERRQLFDLQRKIGSRAMEKLESPTEPVDTLRLSRAADEAEGDGEDDEQEVPQRTEP